MPEAAAPINRTLQASVVIPAHNPDTGRLRRTLAALRLQTLPLDSWETVIVDNASDPPIGPHAFDDVAPANLRILREPIPGLTHARLRGFAGSTGPVVVLVDDDNVLDPDYLEATVRLAEADPGLGAWSGNVVLEFEPGARPPPPSWRHYLTERVVTRDSRSTDRAHHDSTPWGAGMCIRREVCTAYAATLQSDPRRRRLDLRGNALLYGGDTDIAYTACAIGYAKGVFARLKLTHLIPPARCEREWFRRSMEGHAYSNVMHAFLLEGSIPSYFTDSAWLLRSRLRRLFLPSARRFEESAKARGIARAVRDIRNPEFSGDL